MSSIVNGGRGGKEGRGGRGAGGGGASVMKPVPTAYLALRERNRLCKVLKPFLKSRPRRKEKFSMLKNSVSSESPSNRPLIRNYVMGLCS